MSLASPESTAGEAHPPGYVYALGRVRAHFPTLALEKQYAQEAASSTSPGATDRELFQRVISDPTNRYLARKLCWSFNVEGIETYVLVPREPADLGFLIEALRASPDGGDLDVVVGTREGHAPPDYCNGAMLPVVAFDQIYSFDRATLVAGVPRPAGLTKAAQTDFTAAVGEVFDRILQLADNAGATDEHRALNYLSVRYPAVYAYTAAAYQRNTALTSIDVKLSRLSGARQVVDAIFSYTDRATDFTDKQFVRVDVTEEFPFLVTKLSPYYDR